MSEKYIYNKLNIFNNKLIENDYKISFSKLINDVLYISYICGLKTDNYYCIYVKININTYNIISYKIA